MNWITVGQWLVGIVTAMIASQGFWSWLQSKATKKGTEEILNKIVGLESKVEELDKKVDEKFEQSSELALQIEAKNMRERILSFNTSCMRKEKHTTEDFIEILHVITNYNNYCKKHDDFENERANLAIENISRIWGECQQGFTDEYLF